MRSSDLYFCSKELARDLGGKTVRGGLVMVLSQIVKFVLTMVTLSALSRLLLDADYGLIDMALVILGFVTLFREMGLTAATVQRETISHEQVSTLFWLNNAIGLALWAIVAICAFPISWFYHEPRLVLITVVLGGGIPIATLGFQHSALLRRTMQFKQIAIVECVAKFLGAVAAIVLAYYGKKYWQSSNYWALVSLQLVPAVFTTAGFWIACRWTPSLPQRKTGVRQMLAFGGNLTASNFVEYLSRNADKVLIGRAFGKATLGVYGQAFRLLLMPIQQITAPINSVVVPALSRLQKDPDRYRASYKNGVSALVLIGMPIVAFSFVAVEEIVRMFLGTNPQWGEVPVYFRALAPAAFVGTFNAAAPWVFISTGTVNRQLKAGGLKACGVVLSYFIGLQWGAYGIAVAYSVAYILLQIPYFIYCFHGTPVRLADLGVVLWRPTVASLGAAVITYFGVCTLQPSDSVSLFVQMGIYAVSYPCVLLALPNGWLRIMEVVEPLLSIRKQRTSKK